MYFNYSHKAHKHNVKPNLLYYAFGSAIQELSYSSDTTNKYRFGFNGMEKDNESFTDAYDFGARIYDSRIGRWLGQDPLYFKYPEFSPYIFTANNPLVFIDYNGKDFIIFFEKNVKTTIVTNTDNGPVTKVTNEKTFSYLLIPHPGDNKFFYQTDNYSVSQTVNSSECTTCLQSQEKSKVELKTSTSSKEFYPIKNGLINDRYTSFITKSEVWWMTFWDSDIITLAKLAPKDLKDHLYKKDVRYRTLYAYSTGYKITTIGSHVLSLALLTVDIAPAIQSTIKLFSRTTLINILAKNNVKHTPTEIIEIGLNSKQEIIFLEKGNSKAGLKHILEKHGDDFVNKGVKHDDIGNLVFRAATEGKYIKMEGTRPIYEIMYNGDTMHVAVTVSENGFIVGANPITIK